MYIKYIWAPSMEAYDCDTLTQKAKAGGSEVRGQSGYIVILHLKKQVRPGKIAQRIKELAAKLDDLSSSQNPHDEGETQPLQIDL